MGNTNPFRFPLAFEQHHGVMQQIPRGKTQKIFTALLLKSL
jgi:hypothetical protein